MGQSSRETKWGNKVRPNVTKSGVTIKDPKRVTAKAKAASPSQTMDRSMGEGLNWQGSNMGGRAPYLETLETSRLGPGQVRLCRGDIASNNATSETTAIESSRTMLEAGNTRPAQDVLLTGNVGLRYTLSETSNKTLEHPNPKRRSDKPRCSSNRTANNKLECARSEASRDELK